VIKKTDLELAAKAVAVRSIEFRVEAADGSFAGCRTSQPADGVWSCTVDLLAKGIAPSDLTVSLDVEDLSGAIIHDLVPDRKVGYHVPPPKPVTTFTVLPDRPSDADADTGMGIERDKIAWTSPDGYATEFRLYGVIGCPNASPETDGAACLVEHTSLPSGSLDLIKKAGSRSRSMTLETTFTPDASCGVMFWCGTYGALVLSAYNAYGHSKFAIVATENVCWECAGP